MEKKFKITVDGTPYVVTVEEISEDEGRSFPTRSLSMSAPPPSATPAPAAALAAAPVVPAGPGSPDDKTSPLGGVIADVHVSVGQAVSEGEKLVTVEAMKMKTMVSAHKSGSVVAVLVKPGDAVEAGQVLVTIR